MATEYLYFNGTHLFRVELVDEMADGIRIRMAEADAYGNRVSDWTADNTAIYGANWSVSKARLYAEIIRSLVAAR